jgi:hypothetical protein
LTDFWAGWPAARRAVTIPQRGGGSSRAPVTASGFAGKAWRGAAQACPTRM